MQWMIFAAMILTGYGLSAISYMLFLALQRKPFLWVARVSVASGFVAHIIYTLYGLWSRPPFWAISANQSFSLFSGLLVLGFFFIGLRLRVPILGAMLLLAAFFLFLGSLALPPQESSSTVFISKPLAAYWLPVHVLGAIAGEALFVLTAFLGVLFLLQEHQLKSRRPGKLSRLIPSLGSLDRFIEQNLKLGFLFLSIGLLAGALWAHMAMKNIWAWDPKQFWAVVTWCLYAVMIHTRLHFNWKGRRGAIFTIVGLGLVFFTFMGTNFLYPNSHGFWEKSG